MSTVSAVSPFWPAKSTLPCSTCRKPSEGSPAALAASLREITEDTLTAPIGTLPSTSRSREPRNFDSDPHQDRPAASAASRPDIPVLAAQTEVTQLLPIPYQLVPA